MHRNDSGVSRHPYPFRNEKSLNFRGRFRAAFPTRRPLLPPRRTTWGNRFPLQPFRPFTRDPRTIGPRMEHPNMNSNYQGQQNVSSLGIPHSERCEFPPNNFGSYPQNQLPSAPSGTAVNLEVKTPNYGLFSPPAFAHHEELWMETMSENGKMYYYNARSRVTTWDKPQNVKIVNFAQLSSQYNNFQAQNHAMQNREDICNPLNGVLELVPPVPNFAPPIRVIVPFPPPTYYPAPFFTPATSYDGPQVTSNPATNYNVSQVTSIPPPATNDKVPQVTSNPPDAFRVNATSAPRDLKNKTNIQTQTDATNPASSTTDEQNKIANDPSFNRNNCSKKEKMMPYNKARSKKAKSKRENKKTNTKCNDVSSADVEIIYVNEGGNSNNISNDIECIQYVKMKTNFEKEDKQKRSCSDVLPDKLNDDVKNLDKSRPVSMTPVTGTEWFVVWTGDSKVFFYDAYRKISVWHTPEEISGRNDVKKILEKPPPIQEKNKIDSSGSNAKKIKFAFEKSAVSECPLNTSVEKPTIQEMILIATQQREDIPHETRIQMFMKMLSEKEVSAFSTWKKELHKIVFDTRYLLLTHKERKQKFEDYVHEKKEEEKDRKKRKIATIKENFTRLLEEAGVSHHTSFSDFSYKYAKDSRFLAIDRTKEREKLFDIFIRNLRRTASQNSTYSKQPSKFLELLKEQKFLNADSSWSECKKKIADDDRYSAVSSEAQREDLFREFIRNAFPRPVSKGREERIFDSIQTRRKEVEESLSVCMKELDEERLLYKRDSLTNGFNALLADLIKNPDLKYRNAIRCLQDDHRWETVSDLSTFDRERLFDDHILQLKARKRKNFYKLLDELLKEIDLTCTWRDVKKTILSDERCSKIFSDEKTCEIEFYDYMDARLKTAKEDFRQLLKETKIITYASRDLIKNTNHLENIENVLAKDKRYLVLKCVKSERKKMILSHIEDLFDRGPPPPPTASEPSRR